jgi:hypothetical protein
VLLAVRAAVGLAQQPGKYVVDVLPQEGGLWWRVGAEDVRRYLVPERKGFLLVVPVQVIDLQTHLHEISPSEVGDRLIDQPPGLSGYCGS